MTNDIIQETKLKRGKDDIFKLPQVNTNFCKRSLKFLGPKLYNNMCGKKNNITNMSRFKLKEAVTTYLTSITYKDAEIFMQTLR